MNIKTENNQERKNHEYKNEQKTPVVNAQEAKINGTEAHEFMLKEYEKIYDLYKIHYDTSERVLRIYLLILGGFLSIASYIYKDSFNNINLFELESLTLFTLIITSIIGFCMFMMLVEHKIKTIMYVRSINNIRKWFCDKTPSLKPYLLLPIDGNIPRYFVFGKGFFWEICSFGALNSVITSLGIVNILKRAWTNFCCPLTLYIILSLLLLLLHILIFALRGKLKIIQGS